MYSDYSHNYTLYMKCCWGYDINTVFFISQGIMLQFTSGFCVGFLLSIAFYRMFYHSFTTNTCCTRSEIHKFTITKPFLQLWSVLWICELLQSIQFHPPMSAERAGQLIINILDSKYIFFRTWNPCQMPPMARRPPKH